MIQQAAPAGRTISFSGIDLETGETKHRGSIIDMPGPFYYIVSLWRVNGRGWNGTYTMKDVRRVLYRPGLQINGRYLSSSSATAKRNGLAGRAGTSGSAPLNMLTQTLRRIDATASRLAGPTLVFLRKQSIPSPHWAVPGP